MASRYKGLRLLACWDCGFETRRVHGCQFLVTVMCCQVEVSAAARSLYLEVLPNVCVCVFCVSECDQMQH